MTRRQPRGFPIEEPGPTLSRAMAFALSLGYETYDSYDIKSLPLIVATYSRPTTANKLVRKAVYGAELFFPLALRRLLKVPKRASAGGVGRWARACVSAHRLTGEPEWLTEAERALRHLLDHPGSAPVGRGWGLPFVWSTLFGEVPVNTAVSHTTHVCGNAFLDYHEATGDGWARQTAEECCHFLTRALNLREYESGAASLSYTPQDDSEVVNVSAEVLAFLHRCGRPTDQALVPRLAQFIVESQSDDGSWPYSAPWAVSGSNPIDNYHTAMVLHGLLPVLDVPLVRESFEKGLGFHLDRHFQPDGCPKFRPDSVYPIDSYSAGESALLLSHVITDDSVAPTLREKSRATLDSLVDYTVRELSYPDGGFVYRRFRGATMRVDSLRWAQSLLCHALAEFCLAKGLESAE